MLIKSWRGETLSSLLNLIQCLSKRKEKFKKVIPECDYQISDSHTEKKKQKPTNRKWKLSHFALFALGRILKLRVLKMSLWLMNTKKSRRLNQNNTEVLIPVLSWKANSCEHTRKNLGDFILSLKSVPFLHECHFFFCSSLWPTTICRVYSDAIRQLSRNWSHLLWAHLLRSINSFHQRNGSFLAVSYFILFCLSPLSFISWRV